MTITPAIEIENLSLSFDNKSVLKNFSLSVSTGDKFLITGKSGSGKTTLLHCILGFKLFQTGKIFINGKLLDKHTVWSLRENIAYVAQEPVLGFGQAQQILKQQFFFKCNLPIKKNLEKVPEYLARFNLSKSILAQDITKISAGEKQRIALISALLLERKILFLDEVTSALDKSNRDTVLEFLASLKNVTILLVAHDAERFSFANQILDISEIIGNT